jgi:hypothetical protein
LYLVTTSRHLPLERATFSLHQLCRLTFWLLLVVAVALTVVPVRVDTELALELQVVVHLPKQH